MGGFSLKDILFPVDKTGEKNSEIWYKTNFIEEDGRENLIKTSKEYIELYYEVILYEMENLEYLPVDIKYADKLFEYIDRYNYFYKEEEPLTLTKLYNEDIYNRFIDFINNETNDIIDDKVFKDILFILEKNKSIIDKIDKLIYEHSKDGISGYIPHICLYENDIQKFVNKEKNSPIKEFRQFVDIGLIPLDEFIKKVSKIKKINNKEEALILINEIIKKDILNEEDKILVVEFIKLHRKSNLEKKKYHTYRVVALAENVIKDYNIPDFYKKIILISALYHDIGRFYHAAYFDGFSEAPLTRYEREFGDGEELEEFKHAKFGYYVSLNSLIDFNDKGLQPLKNDFNLIAPLISIIVKNHGMSNVELKCLDDNCNIEILENGEFFKKEIIKSVASIYEICMLLNYKKLTHNPAYNTIVNESDFYDLYKTLKNLSLISRELKDLDSVMFEKVIDVTKENYQEYNFADMFLQILESSSNNEIPLYKKLIIDILNLNEEEVKSSNLIFRERIKEKLNISGKEADELINKIKHNLEIITNQFKSLVTLASLVVMDVDKLDIIVQMATGWLDNDIHKDNLMVNIPVNKISNSSVIDFEDYFGFRIEKNIIDLINKINGKNIVYQFNDRIYINIIECNISKNKEYYRFLLPIETLKKEDNNKTPYNNLTTRALKLKRCALPNDVIDYYLCIDEQNEIDKNKTLLRFDNSLQIIWWRINEFIIRNMRNINSIKNITEAELFANLVSYVNKLDPDMAQLIKPIIYVAELYIEKIQKLNINIITQEKSNQIRKEIGEELLLYNSSNTDELFNVLIELYDKKHNLVFKKTQ